MKKKAATRERTFVDLVAQMLKDLSSPSDPGCPKDCAAIEHDITNVAADYGVDLPRGYRLLVTVEKK